jgi:hypothetical protein
MPTQVGGADAQNVNDPKNALARMRAASPELKPTSAQAYSRVYEDPANHALAERAHGIQTISDAKSADDG